jgi:hypothetical protein
MKWGRCLPYIGDERWPGDIPFVRREEKDVGARRVHLVTFARMNGFLLDGLDLKWFKFLIENLTLDSTC